MTVGQDENRPAGPGLRPLTGEEAALVAAFPLPPGIADAVVNKAQLEVGLGVSQTTITKWLRRPVDPIPFEAEGANGQSYEFRLSVAYAWMRRMRSGEEAARSAADDSVQQLQLALLGGDTEADEGANGRLTIKQQRELMELTIRRNQAAREKGELVWRADVVVLFEDYNAAVRDALDALPDRLARELGLEGRALERIEAACDDILAGAVQKVRGVIGDGETGSGIGRGSIAAGGL